MKILVTDKSEVEHELEFQFNKSLGETLFYSSIDIDIQPFAICGFECQCRTCHVIIDEEYFDKLPEIKDEEDYLLNTSLYREKNSRLSCQVKMNENLDGMKVKIPADF